MADQPISVLEQRRIEAGVLKPLVRAFEAELGRERAREILAEVIKGLAREKGAAMAKEAGGNSLGVYATLKEPWVRNGALEFTVLTEEEDAYDFNVTRCRYAEMYREMGLEDLGFYLSCNRDGTLIEGFNPGLELTRTQTIMQGAAFCDFRYRKRGSS